MTSLHYAGVSLCCAGSVCGCLVLPGLHYLFYIHYILVLCCSLASPYINVNKHIAQYIDSITLPYVVPIECHCSAVCEISTTFNHTYTRTFIRKIKQGMA